MEVEKINDAIVNHLSILWTDESKDDIIGIFGIETYSDIQKIASDIANIWPDVDDLTAHRRSIEMMEKKYPFLSKAAMIKLADAAAYFWKSE